MLEGCIVLEHKPDVATLGRQRGGVGAVDEYRSGVGLIKSRDDRQQGGLAAAAGPEQSRQLAAADVDAHVVEGDEVAESLGYVQGLDSHDRLLRPFLGPQDRDHNDAYDREGNHDEADGVCPVLVEVVVTLGGQQRHGLCRAEHVARDHPYGPELPQ